MSVLPPFIRYLLIESCFSGVAFFMAMPFLALKMSESTGVAAHTIGAVIGLGPLFALFMGFYVSHLSDLWGRRNIIRVAILLAAVAYLGFAFASTPLEYGVMISLNGLSRAFFDPVVAALITDICRQSAEPELAQKKAMHYRYFAINVGASVGPLIGSTVLIANPRLGFEIAAAVFALRFVSFSMASNFYGVKAMESTRVVSTHRFSETLRVVFTDRLLQLYLLAYFLISLGYSQMETNLPLHLRALFGDSGVGLFGQVNALNGALVVLCSIPLLAWSKRININLACAISSIVFGIGYLLFGNAKTAPEFYLAMAFVAIGEIVLFANGYLLIESLAPAHMRGAYLGTTNIAQTGFVIGPMVGGYLIEFGGGRLMFFTTATLMCVCAVVYVWAKRRTKAHRFRTSN